MRRSDRHPVLGISAEDAMRLLPPRLGRGDDWYRIENAAGDEAQLYIYDVIGWPWITADEFVRDLQGVSARRIVARISSPGGDVFDGIAIANALRDHPAEVTTRNDSLAASIASVIFMAGDHRVMNRASTLMIHDPWSFALGDARELRRQADILDQLGDTIAGVYADGAGGSVRSWRDYMLDETWYTDREATDAGLAHEVAGAEAPANRFDLSVFRHPPAALARPAGGDDHPRLVTPRAAERALRDAGLSRMAARRVLSRGWDALDGDPRDAGADEDDARDVRALEALKATLSTALIGGGR